MSFVGNFGRAIAIGVFATFASQAAIAASYSVTVLSDPTLSSMTSLGYQPFNLGSSATAGAINTGVVGSGTVNNQPEWSASFTGTSGVWSGDINNVVRSPFRDGSGAATTLNYFAAQANSGSILFSYSTSQTSLSLLWGSVDNVPVDYNKLLFQFSNGQGGSTTTVTGADIINAYGAGSPPIVPGTTNLLVTISGLDAFSFLTVTASQQAFEFDLVTRVPEPATLALLGAGLLGLGVARRRRA